MFRILHAVSLFAITFVALLTSKMTRRMYAESAKFDRPVRRETYVGGLVFRRTLVNNTKSVEYLVLQSGLGNRPWIIPKGIGGIVEFDPNFPKFEYAAIQMYEKLRLRNNEIYVLPGFEKHIKYRVRNTIKDVRYFLVELVDTTCRIEDRLSWHYKGLKWLPYEEALSAVFFPNMRGIIEGCHEFLKNISVV